MPFQHIDQISEWLAGTGLSLELDGPQGSVRLGDDFADRVVVPTDIMVTAPGIGIFRHRHPMSPVALVLPGARVDAGEIVGLLQVGVLLTPVLAPQGGHVAGHLVADGDIAGFGTKLICLHPLIEQSMP